MAWRSRLPFSLLNRPSRLMTRIGFMKLSMMGSSNEDNADCPSRKNILDGELGATDHWTADAAQEADPVWAIDALNNGKLVVVNLGTPLARLRVQTHAGVLEAE